MSQNQTITVRKNDTIMQYEEHMREIAHGPATLKLPQDISQGGALGQSVSLTQLIATWASKNSDPTISTTLADDRDKAERFTSHLHGLAAAYFAKKITGTDKDRELKQDLLKSATKRILAMSNRQYRKTSRGRVTEFIFVNGATHQFHSAAYRKEPISTEVMDPETHGKLIVTQREMNAMVHNALLNLNLPRLGSEHIFPKLFNRHDTPIGTLLHETFRNTAEHAYLDLHGRIPQKGIRCILISVRYVDAEKWNLRSIVSNEHAQIDSYFTYLKDRATNRQRRNIRLLELSVLDTGPGFASTMTCSNNQRATDAMRVAVCFEDKKSSKSGVNSGMGLGRVLTQINALDGFLRVRTSTTEVFFSSRSKVVNSTLVPLVFGNLPEVTGTVLTMAVPLIG